MRKFKPGITLLLVLTLVLSAAILPLSATAEAALLDDGNTYAEGLRIVKEPITLRVAVTEMVNLGDVASRSIWKKIEEETGIKLEFTFYSNTETANLLFASREYPDITFRLDANSTTITDCFMAGDLVKLNDYLDYAPTIKAFMDANPNFVTLLTESDGNIYSFAQVFWDETAFNMRDQLFINKVGLE